MPLRGVPCHPWPALSALGTRGVPHRPLVKPILRLVPGHTRKHIPPLYWNLNSPPECEGYELQFCCNGLPSQSVILGVNGFADHWIDLASQEFNLLVYVRNPVGELLGSVSISDLVIRQALKACPKPALLRCPIATPAGQVAGYFTCDLCLILPLPQAISEHEARAFQLLGMTRTEPGSQRRATPFVAGHRGCGAPGTTSVPENTLLSFVLATRDAAVSHVEIDVQLLSDGTPAVFHDYFLHDPAEGPQRFVYGINTATFRTCKPPDMLRQRQQTPGQGLDDTSRVMLPTLSDTCQLLPADIGLVVEIKYPIPEDVEVQKIVYPERNEIVDAVLKVILAPEVVSSGRDILLTSFDPELCLLLVCKQRVFPVYFGNSELREVGNDVFDPRTQSFHAALAFAVSNGMAGLVILADIVLEETSLVAEADALGVPILTYSPSNRNHEWAREQLKAGVRGLIVDGADSLPQTFKNEILIRQAANEANGRL